MRGEERVQRGTTLTTHRGNLENIWGLTRKNALELTVPAKKSRQLGKRATVLIRIKQVLSNNIGGGREGA